MEQITPLLTVGAQFEMSGCEFEVAGIRHDALRIAPLKGGMMKHLKFEAVASLIESNAIRITYAPPGTLNSEVDRQLGGLSPKQQLKVRRQRRWVQAIFKRLPDRCYSQRAIAKEIPAIKKELGEDEAPSTATLVRWVGKWNRGGRTDAALMPKLRYSRADHRGIDPVVVDYLNDSIQTIYLTRQRSPMSAVYSDLQINIVNHNAASDNKLTMPSRETVRRFVNRLDQYERDLRRHGAHYARRRHHAAGVGFVAREPLELCMADGKVMDIILIEPPRDDGEPQQALGRPYLTVIIDVRTRCVPAAYVSFAPFSGATLLKTMATAVVAGPGKPRGVMRRLLVDNGSDYRDAGFARFCASLDIQLEPCPPKMPNGKAIVERFFRTMDEGLIRKLPGTTFSNPTDRGDYESQKLARVTLKELQDQVDTWIHEVYHQTPHRALGRAPMAVWADEVMP